MKDRLHHIRESEKKSHIETYTNEKLYDTDSWLQKPIKTVMDILPFFEEYNELKVLDLGCGVGRNSICVAEKYKGINCVIDCVDLLDIAIEKLQQNAKEHNVNSNINGFVCSIEDYNIGIDSYDFIMAVSALEHTDTEQSFLEKLTEIKNGLKENGIACLVINSDIKEMVSGTNEILDAQFEVNLPTEVLQTYLDETFNGWSILKATVSQQEYDIPRNNIISHLNTNVVTYVARKCKM